jgi:hypothetical protein
MKYQCLNNECKKTFVHTAKQIRSGLAVGETTLESYVCPFCQSKEYTEFIEPVTVTPPKQVSNVFIYELTTTGAQPNLDAMLADGYEIVNRFSKQYHLEKPKLADNKVEAFRKWLNDDGMYNIEHAQGLLELVKDQFNSLFPSTDRITPTGEGKPQ